MRDPESRRPRRVLVAAIAGGAILLLLVAVGIYGLIRGPQEPGTSRPHATVPHTSEAPAKALTPKPLPSEESGEAFAREVAVRMFGWDTRLVHGPADHMQPLVDAADPEEAPGLASDLRGYFPDARTWAELRRVETRQWIDVDTVEVPAGWAQAEAQAGAGQLPPGAIAYTIRGTRHREGVWEGRALSDARPVAFTIFAACPPDDGCRLLRLSTIDQPLR